MSNVSAPDEFHRFSELPPEIRDFIWSLCLPHRVRELDEPSHFVVFGVRPAPCYLCPTTRRNRLPPLISRVCRESRAVASKTRTTVSPPDFSDPAYWSSSGTSRRNWADAARDVPHLNWTPVYEADWPGYGNALEHMAWEISHALGRGSVMLKYFYPGYWYPRMSAPPLSGPALPGGFVESEKEELRRRDRAALRRFPKWQVVMAVVVVHSDAEYALATGLFGSFGEELVKIIDAADKQTCDGYYELAERCERRAAARVTAPQKIRREPLHALKERLTGHMMCSFECEELAELMHPAIMFRLCTDKCNEREITEEDYED